MRISSSILVTVVAFVACSKEATQISENQEQKRLVGKLDNPSETETQEQPAVGNLPRLAKTSLQLAKQYFEGHEFVDKSTADIIDPILGSQTLERKYRWRINLSDKTGYNCRFIDSSNTNVVGEVILYATLTLVEGHFKDQLDPIEVPILVKCHFRDGLWHTDAQPNEWFGYDLETALGRFR